MSERERLIRAAWDWFKSTGYEWPVMTPRLKVPLPRNRRTDYDRPTPLECLTFEREHGRYQGFPAIRIVCDDIVLEIWAANQRII